MSALALLLHEVDDTHDAALSWEHGHLHLRLQHIEAGRSHGTRVATHDVTPGVARQGHGTEHADHVFHPGAPEQFVRAATGDFSPYASPHGAFAEVLYRAIPPRDDRLPRGSQARARSSPALDILRSAVLLI